METIKDVVHLLPPFDAATARRRIDTLRLRPLLDEQRGRPAAAIDSFCEVAALFSVVVADFGDVLNEIDLNPVIVHASACVAVDAFVAGRAGDFDFVDERQVG